LAVADALGRPVAILRMGGRLPETSQNPDPIFFFGCPPFVCYPSEPLKSPEKETRKFSPGSDKNQEVKIIPPPSKKVVAKSDLEILEGLKP